MPDVPFNKYRAALEVIQRGRDTFVESLADQILEEGDQFPEASFRWHEFLEIQGTKLHFLILLVGQLESSAAAFDEANAPPPKARAKTAARRATRSKRLAQEPSKEERTDDA